MSTKVQAIPERYKAATPYLSVDGAARAIEFYKQAFGAVETMRMDGPGGRIMHAEVTIGAAPIMLSDEWPEMGFRGPEALGGSPVQLYGLRGRRGRARRACGCRRSERAASRQRSVLRRPHRADEGFLRPSLVVRDAHGGRAGGRATTPCRSVHGGTREVARAAPVNAAFVWFVAAFADLP